MIKHLRSIAAAALMAVSMLSAKADDFSFDYSYYGNLEVEMFGKPFGTSKNEIKVAPCGQDSITLILDNFTLSMGTSNMYVGTIKVDSIKVENSADGFSFSKEDVVKIEPGYYPVGEDVAWTGAQLPAMPVSVEGTLVDGKLVLAINIESMKVNVKFTSDPSTSFSGPLSVEMNGNPMGTSEQVIKIVDRGDGMNALMLSNFSLGVMHVGNILVDSIPAGETISHEAGIVISKGSYPADADWFGHTLGVVPVSVNGTVASGNLDLVIDINMPDLGVIKVSFDGVSTSISEIPADTETGVKAVYTVSGVKVGDSTDNLPSGIYIVKENGKSYKILK